MKAFLSPAPIQLNKATAAIRIVIGFLLIYHGLELLDSEIMKGYMEWEVFMGNAGATLVYAGKSAELISGALFVLGLFTRAGALVVFGTFSYITFFVGHGNFWYEDQHPFMFVLFGVLFFFTGPGAWNLDEKLFSNKNH